MPGFQYHSPDAALAALLPHLSPVETERLPSARACGRVLAEPLVLDRDSPACDVSAMDGYALRLADLGVGTLPVSGEAAAGNPPPECAPGTAVRIFTGAPVPAGCDIVVKREDVLERPDRIDFGPQTSEMMPGNFIRRWGENGRAGDSIAAQGRFITAATLAAGAACGVTSLLVHRRVRVAVLTTGDEVCAADATPEPWQIRDSNGPALAALLGSRAYVDAVAPEHVADDPRILTATLLRLIASHDAVFVTGGVSAGDYDYVPAAVAACGGTTVFHKLPIRPGKPLLAATAGGTLILGLPGNPVSVLYCARRFGIACLRKLAGCSEPEQIHRVTLLNPDARSLPLHWGRLVTLSDEGATLLPTASSGDIITAARSDGFVEISAGESGPGPWRFWAW